MEAPGEVGGASPGPPPGLRRAYVWKLGTRSGRGTCYNRRFCQLGPWSAEGGGTFPKMKKGRQ